VQKIGQLSSATKRENLRRRSTDVVRAQLGMQAHDFVLPERSATVVIVGSGVAGLWTAYQLAKAGIESIVVADGGADRGGIQGASRRSAGAINLAPLNPAGLDTELQRLGHEQTHPDVANILGSYLEEALAELEGLVELKTIKIGKQLACGSGEHLLRRLSDAYRALGGSIIDAWVTRLVADRNGCRGLQYQAPAGIGKLRSKRVILASGGYAGLLGNATRTQCYGTVSGLFLRCGGLLSNLEFVFKHGYGDIDSNALTPTEELPGAEIRGNDGQRVRFLEEILFRREGTHSHLAAARFWSRHGATKFFVNLGYRPLYLKLQHLKQELDRAGQGAATSNTDALRETLVESFPAAARASVEAELAGAATIDFALFERMKRFCEPTPTNAFRVAPLIYFTMGGVAHSRLRTSLPGVFVTGEAMHDFGANRVGGLPWGLYLAAGRLLCEQLQGDASRTGGEDFELAPKRSRFDAGAFASIQARLNGLLDGGMKGEEARELLLQLRAERRALAHDTQVLHDVEAGYLLGEAVLESALCRRESRGFFYRVDYPEENSLLGGVHSAARYDAERDEVRVTLRSRRELEAECRAAWRTHGVTPPAATFQHRSSE
jgi:succinate dehydrogenase/fumarate reductase flavoprotein subunit